MSIATNFCMALAVLGAVLPATSWAEEAEYGIREKTARTGTTLRRHAVEPLAIPINRKYSQLSAEDRAKLHSWWELIPEGDEPPFPADGLKPMLDALRQAQERLQVRGELLLIATVDKTGKVVQVSALGSPSHEMTKFAATVVSIARFKPAVCSGQPCQMDFPIQYKFANE